MTKWLATLLLVGSASACNNPSRAAAPAGEPMSGREPVTGDPAPASELPVSSSETRTVALTIEGIVCQGCAEAARQALEDAGGVVTAEVDFETGVATVVFDSSQTRMDALVTAIEAIERDPAPAFRVIARDERH